MDKRIEVSKFLADMAEYYAIKLSPNQVKLYVDDLIDVGLDDLRRAFTKWRNKSENFRFPLPGQLKAELELTDNQLARDAVSRIVEALHRMSGNEIRAKEFIGELGWAVVKRLGGWDRLTRAHYDEIGPIAQAQWRGIAETMIANARLGKEEAPKLPIMKLESIGIVMKRLE